MPVAGGLRRHGSRAGGDCHRHHRLSQASGAFPFDPRWIFPRHGDEGEDRRPQSRADRLGLAPGEEGKTRPWRIPAAPVVTRGLVTWPVVRLSRCVTAARALVSCRMGHRFSHSRVLRLDRFGPLQQLSLVRRHSSQGTPSLTPDGPVLGVLSRKGAVPNGWARAASAWITHAITASMIWSDRFGFGAGEATVSNPRSS
jgi:hypothetical protein